MVLPSGDEYNESVQNPKIAFTDTDLKNSSVEEWPSGLPRPYSGGFTTTFKLQTQNNNWAVRCFTKEILDLQKRYKAIDSFLSSNPSQYFVDAKYLSEGIKVNGKGYPIIKMLWLEGDTLDNYLEKTFNQKEKIEKLLLDFINLVNELEKFGIAHGDLQHGNVVVKNDKIYLIDYDGMYFPELASLKTNEFGHPNYQHPKRLASHYNQYIDRFSSIVIYIVLKAISLNPNLWKKYPSADSLLFKSKDFADLQNSSLIQDLSAIPVIKPLVERLVGCCYLDFEKVPSLKDFLTGNFIYDKSAVGTISITRSQYAIIDATKRGSLMEHVGVKVEVVGKISGKHTGTTYNGSSYIFLNFGIFPNQTFTLVVWQEGITALTAKGMSPSSLIGKYVSVTGIIGSFERKPQMSIEQASQIQVLSSELEVSQKLKINPTSITSPPPQLTKVKDREANVFNELYKNKPVYTPPKTTVNTIPPKSTYTPPPPKYSTSQTSNSKNASSKSGKSGCFVLLIFGLVGAIAIGAASNGKMWYAGALGGGFIGTWVQTIFKS